MPIPLQKHAAAQDQGITARLFGGVAVVLGTVTPLPDVLQRTYEDLDYVVRRADARRWRDFLDADGYQSDVQFNTLHGSQRLLHYDTLHNRQVDTFVSTFAMCHAIDLEDHLPTDSLTLAPEDILLTKRQIFEVNDKTSSTLSPCSSVTLSRPVMSPASIATGSPRSSEPTGAGSQPFQTTSPKLLPGFQPWGHEIDQAPRVAEGRLPMSLESASKDSDLAHSPRRMRPESAGRAC